MMHSCGWQRSGSAKTLLRKPAALRHTRIRRPSDLVPYNPTVSQHSHLHPLSHNYTTPSIIAQRRRIPTLIWKQQARFLSNSSSNTTRSTGKASPNENYGEQENKHRNNIPNSNTNEIDTTENPTLPLKDKLDPRATEWIPPNRYLVGDKGYSHLYGDDAEQKELSEIEREIQLLEEEELLSEDEKLQRLEQELTRIEQEEDEIKAKSQPVKPQPVDHWMQYSKTGKNKSQLTPSFQKPGFDLEVLHHTLLTSDEITGFLERLGASNLKVVQDQAVNEHGDSRLSGGFRGIVFVTGHSPAHVRMLASSLVEQLKLRQLQEVGVVGARHGYEGSDDPDESWLAVDCENYIVNIMDETTRQHLKLEDWWSRDNSDPLAEYMEEGMSEEDAMEEFVARNPVPPNYGRSHQNWSATISQLEQQRWTAPHKKVVAQRFRKKGKRKRRK